MTEIEARKETSGAAIPIKDSAIDSLINIILQISEGLLEGERKSR